MFLKKGAAIINITGPSKAPSKAMNKSTSKISSEIAAQVYKNNEKPIINHKITKKK